MTRIVISVSCACLFGLALLAQVADYRVTFRSDSPIHRAVLEGGAAVVLISDSPITEVVAGPEPEPLPPEPEPEPPAPANPAVTEIWLVQSGQRRIVQDGAVIQSGTPYQFEAIAVGPVESVQWMRSNNGGVPYQWGLDNTEPYQVGDNSTPAGRQIQLEAIPYPQDGAQGTPGLAVTRMVIFQAQAPTPAPTRAEASWDPVTTDIDGNTEVVAHYILYRNDVEIARPAGTVHQFDLVSGPNKIQVTAVDEAGNESVKSPAVEISSP